MLFRQILHFYVVTYRSILNDIQYNRIFNQFILLIFYWLKYLIISISNQCVILEEKTIVSEINTEMLRFCE